MMTRNKTQKTYTSHAAQKHILHIMAICYFNIIPIGEGITLPIDYRIVETFFFPF